MVLIGLSACGGGTRSSDTDLDPVDFPSGLFSQQTLDYIAKAKADQVPLSQRQRALSWLVAVDSEQWTNRDFGRFVVDVVSRPRHYQAHGFRNLDTIYVTFGESGAYGRIRVETIRKARRETDDAMVWSGRLVVGGVSHGFIRLGNGIIEDGFGEF